MKPTKALFGLLTVTAALAIQVQAQTSLTNGLVAYYPFEGNANDASGNGNNGTVYGATLTADRFGLLDSAYRFNGTSWIQLPDALLPVAASELTLSAWVLADAGPYTTQEQIIDLTSRRGECGIAIVSASGACGVHLQNSGWQSCYGGTITNVWVQLVEIYKQGQYLQLWINGSLAQSNGIPNESLYTNAAYPLNSAIGIYALASGPSQGFTGTIDDVRIYNRAFSACEVQQLYAYESVPPCVSPPPGLVGWWPGEGNAADFAGTDNGTLVGGVTFAAGEVGQTFKFNGENQYVQIADSPTLRPVSVSLECWFNASGTSGSLISKPVGAGYFDSYVLWFGNGLLVGAAGNSSVQEVLTYAFSPVPGVWYHTAYSFDGNSHTETLYLNGVRVASGPANLSLGYDSHPVLIGTELDYNSPVVPFSGEIDEVSIYNRVLSASEIASIYNAGSAGKCAPLPPSNCIPPPSGLVAWWPGEGNANDIAGTNKGTLSGGASFAGGEVGQAFSFDGVGALVQVPSSPAVSFGSQSPMTVELWAYRTGSAPLMHILGKRNVCYGDSSQTDYQMYFNMYSGQGLGFGGGSGTAADSGLDMPMNTWTYLVGTFDGSNLRLYINGTLSATGIGALGPPNTAPLLIGGSADCQKFAGLIDEVSMYNRALSADEIAAIYNAGSRGKCAPRSRVATASAVVVNGFVVSATITDGGYGYTNTPLVKIIGGGGSGAQAVAVVSNGVVVAVNFLDAGSGYTSMPLVVIGPPFVPHPVLSIAPMSFLAFSNLTVGGVYQLQRSVGGYWSDQPISFTATNTLYTQTVAGVASVSDFRLALNPVPAQAFATAQVEYGFVIHATVTSGGSGYVTTPAVTFVGGGGSNATAVASLSGGVVTSITITDAGIGYTNTPTVRIAPPPPGAGLSPTVLPMMRVDSASLAPYDNYQIQFKPDLNAAWGNWNGGLFSPADVTNSQYVFITNSVGFFRLQYVP